MSDLTITETDQFLTFKLGSEHYAVEVLKVKEVLEMQQITRIPKTPDFMRGIINIRGGVVPVLDLRLKFGMEQKESTVDTCIIVLEVEIGEDIITLGVIADSVQEVVEILSENIEPPPQFGTGLNTEFIKGIGKTTEKFLIILDTDRIFSADEARLAMDRAEAG